MPNESDCRANGAEHAPSVLDHRAHLRVVEHEIARGEHNAERDIKRDVDEERRPLHREVAGQSPVHGVAEEPRMHRVEQSCVHEPHDDREPKKAEKKRARN